MDELERATAELSRLIEGLTEDRFQAVCNPDAEEEDFRSIQRVVHHVVRAGYAHANHLRIAFSVPGSRVEVPLGTRSESRAQLSAMVEYMEATLDGRWAMTDEEIEAVEIQSRWGTTYDLEQMLEHAVVHVLRHRRQIERFLADSLQTEERLREDLARLGVTDGMILMVHSSLSTVGWVLGGPQTVVRALLGALGDGGTLAMPAATPLCADPATWQAPRVPDERLAEAREHLPLFDLRTTPTSLGAIPEAFRTWPGTLRSDHPLESVCARGPAAAEITRDHPLAFSEGEGGPFGKLHELDSHVLLLGVGFNRCTALHFAESLAPKRRTTTVRFPVLEEGRRAWFEVPNVADDNDTHFPVIGERFLATGGARRGRVGDAPAVLFPMRALVDVAVRYFDETF